MAQSVVERIKQEIADNEVVLYMKGTTEMPMCGFSGTVVSILKQLNIAFKAVNILENEELRQGVKDFSDWPTIPQLYVRGEFIGGCDIVREMYVSGELATLFNVAKAL
jgi:monothiol glutaredoxin